MQSLCSSPCTLSVNGDDPMEYCRYKDGEWKETPVHATLVYPFRSMRENIAIMASSSVDAVVTEGSALRAELVGTAHHCGEIPKLDCKITEDSLFISVTFANGTCPQTDRSKLTLNVTIPAGGNINNLTVVGHQVTTGYLRNVKKYLSIHSQEDCSITSSAQGINVASRYGGCNLAIPSEAGNVKLKLDCAKSIMLTVPKTAKLEVFNLDVDGEDESQTYTSVVTGSVCSHLDQCGYERI